MFDRCPLDFRWMFDRYVYRGMIDVRLSIFDIRRIPLHDRRVSLEFAGCCWISLDFVCSSIGLHWMLNRFSLDVRWTCDRCSMDVRLMLVRCSIDVR